MQTEVLNVRGTPILAGRPGEPLLPAADDVIGLLEACFPHAATSLLLHPENLPAGFFELRTGEAGEILQRLRTYGIRLALVARESELPEGRFAEMRRDRTQSNDFRVFGDRADALAWLGG